MLQFDLEKEKLAVIITSTTGDGEPPETAEKFWRKIKKKSTDPNMYQGLRFAILGWCMHCCIVFSNSETDYSGSSTLMPLPQRPDAHELPLLFY